jgi:hypothetical protein
MSEGGRRRGLALGALIIAASFFAGGYLFIRYAIPGQKAKIARLEDLAERLKAESVPVKLKVLSRDAQGITARIRIYDLAGREVSMIERSWPGGALYVDMLLVPLERPGASGSAGGTSYMAFPYRIFTDQLSPARGTTLFDSYERDGFPRVMDGLFDSYERDGFPRVMDGIEWSGPERAAIAAAYGAARASAAAGEPATSSAAGAFGAAVHEATGIARLEEGVVYEVVCRVKGGVEIVEE